MIELGKIQPADLVAQRGSGLIELNGLRESFARYIVDPSQLPNWAEIEAVRGHPQAIVLFDKAERLAERMTNNASDDAQAKLSKRLAQLANSYGT